MSIRTTFILVVALFFSPVIAQAALNAGVVNGVWFSNPNPEADEEVRIFTAVQNQSQETITGNVAFLVNTEIVGSAAFTIQSNDVIPISVKYVFPGGDYDVSAYITSVENQSVAYTIVSETYVSVSGTQTETNAFEQEKDFSTASTTLSQTKEVLLDSSKDILDTIEPLVESVAVNLEDFRDSLLATTTDSEVILENSDGFEETSSETPSKTAASKKFLVESKTIATNTGLTIWKKVTGISLSLLALVVRFWFVPLVLLVLLIFWLLIRGRRIR